MQNNILHIIIIVTTHNNMRSSVKLRFFIAVLYAIFLHIFLYFSKQDRIGDYIVYIVFAMMGVPVFLFVILGMNNNND
jgi:VanZ family protein